MTSPLRTLSLSVLGLVVAASIGLSGATSATADSVTTDSQPSDVTVSLAVGTSASPGPASSSRGGWTWGGVRSGAGQ